MSGEIRLVLRLPWGADVRLRNAAGRYVERGKIIRPAMARHCAVELLEQWADQERREAEVRARVQALGSHPVRALLAVAAELRGVERELRALAFGLGAPLAAELLVLAGELETALAAAPAE